MHVRHHVDVPRRLPDVEVRVAHVLRLASLIRGVRPDVVLAPSLAENQHPDHPKLGRMVRDAARLARYGGVKELRNSAPHAIGTLLFYAVTPEAEPADLGRARPLAVYRAHPCRGAPGCPPLLPRIGPGRQFPWSFERRCCRD